MRKKVGFWPRPLFDKKGAKMTESEWMLGFAKRLDQKMKEERITQKELSMLTGISEAAISNYLTAKQMPRLFAAMKIAEALHSNIFELKPL